MTIKEFKELRCPNCNKKLLEYSDETDGYWEVDIKCKCKKIISLLLSYGEESIRVL